MLLTVYEQREFESLGYMPFAIFLFEALVCKTHFEGEMVSSMSSFSSIFLCLYDFYGFFRKDLVSLESSNVLYFPSL